MLISRPHPGFWCGLFCGGQTATGRKALRGTRTRWETSVALQRSAEAHLFIALPSALLLFCSIESPTAVRSLTPASPPVQHDIQRVALPRHFFEGDSFPTPLFIANSSVWLPLQSS